MTEDLRDWMEAGQIVELAMFDLGISKAKEDLGDSDIRKIMHYIGQWADETDFTNLCSPRLGLFAIGVMLTVCLLEFPEYYEKYQLSQYN
jgi:hypothetical protein